LDLLLAKTKKERRMEGELQFPTLPKRKESCRERESLLQERKIRERRRGVGMKGAAPLLL
jgi:hypothetical protein